MVEGMQQTMGWLHMLAGGCGTVFITNNPDTHQTIPTIPTHCAPRVTIADLRPKTFYISKLGQNTFINSAATNSTTGGPHVNHGHHWRFFIAVQQVLF